MGGNAVYLDCACAVCGEMFRIAEYRVRQGGGKYCSKACQGIGSVAARAARTVNAGRMRERRWRQRVDRADVPVTPRRCLACRATFPSSGPGNRVCDRCKATENWRAGHEIAL